MSPERGGPGTPGRRPPGREAEECRLMAKPCLARRRRIDSVGGGRGPPPARGAMQSRRRASRRTSMRCSTQSSERDEYLELAKRTKADFENYRKRMAAEVQAAAARGKAELAAQLIGVIDNLERALAAAGVEPAARRRRPSRWPRASSSPTASSARRSSAPGSSPSTRPASASTRPATRRCRSCRSRGPSRAPSSRRCRRATGSASS